MIRPLPRPEGAHSKDYTRLQMSKIKIQANIVGWGHTAFGKLSGDTIESLIASAAKQAIVHAGIDPRDIDAVWLGHFNSGMVTDAFCSSLVLGALDALVRNSVETGKS